MGEVNPVMQFSFAMEIRGSAKLILGNKGGPRGIEGEVHASADKLRF